MAVGQHGRDQDRLREAELPCLPIVSHQEGMSDKCSGRQNGKAKIHHDVG